MPIIREMNQRLKDEMDNRTFFKRFDANLAQLEMLANEIVEHSEMNIPSIGSKPSNPLVRADSFESVLNPTPRELASQARLESSSIG